VLSAECHVASNVDLWLETVASAATVSWLYRITFEY